MVQAPQNVKVEIDKNTVTIRFEKGLNAKTTEIDRFWVNGEGTYDEYTSGNAFYYEGLEWGTTYHFRLRSFSESGEIAETDVVSFKIEDAIIPTLPTNVKTSVYKNTATITFDKGNGTRTYIDKFWVDGEGTLDEYTTGNGFFLEDLPWGLEGKFTLTTLSNTGEKVTTDVFSFKIEDEIIPTPPTDIKVVTYLNNAEIRFTRGNAQRTLIDKYWVNGEGTFDEYTYTDSVFYLNDLDWGGTYKFKLRSEGNTGLYADSEEITFTIEEEIIPTPPTDVKITVFKNNAQVVFTKGEAARTYIDKYWVNGEGTFDEYVILSNIFYLENLEWGTTYKFKLRSEGNTGKVADTEEFTFTTETLIPAKLPDIVSCEPYLNTCVIRMQGHSGIRVEIAKEWDGGLDNFVEYTTGSAFYYEALEWGTTYRFKLRAVSNDGSTVTSDVYSFDIVANPTPIAPSDITQLLGEGNVTIKFTKGNGVKTEIAASWLPGGISSWGDYTTGEAFYFEGLQANSKYQYKLRTVSIGGQTAESEIITFYTPISW